MRKDIVGVGMCTGSGMCQTTHSYRWAFADTELGEADWQNHDFPDTHENKQDNEHKAEAEAARSAYLTELSAKLEAQYSDLRATLRKWQDSIYEWNEHLPPGQPATAPSIDPAGWGGDAPSDSVWKKYRVVRYAVQFYNDKGPKNKGPGLLGPWSTAVELAGKARPKLLDIPVDAQKMAIGRRVYRKFDSEPERLVGLITDNTTTTYTDGRNT